MIKQLQSVQDVVAAASEAVTVFKSEIWWRGQPDATWPLVPSVYRRDRGTRYEKNISLKFVQRAASRHVKCPGINEPAGWLFLMQHYRLPTRLLDWTESILVATFFAVASDGEQPGVLWALDPFGLNDVYTGGRHILPPTDPQAFPLFAMPFADKPEEVDKALAVVTNEVDLRMLMQLSAFTIHATRKPLDGATQKDRFLLRFEIPAAAKPRIRLQLSHCGVRRSSIFPDLENLSVELADGMYP